MKRPLGFTLVEMIVAMTLVAFMSFLLISTVRTTRAAQAVSEERSERTFAAAAALDMLVSDINMAYLSMAEDATVEFKRTFFKAVFDLGGMDVMFSTLSHRPSSRNAKESDSCVVHYRLERDPESKGRYSLVRSESYRLEASDPLNLPARTRRLVRGVAVFEMWFFDPTRDEWIDTWDTTTLDGQNQRLPSLVRIHLGVDTGTGFIMHFHTMARPHIQEPLNLLPATGRVTQFKTQEGTRGGSSDGSRPSDGSSRPSRPDGGGPSRPVRPIEMPKVQ